MTPSHWKYPTRRQVLSAAALATVAIPVAALPGRALALRAPEFSFRLELDGPPDSGGRAHFTVRLKNPDAAPSSPMSVRVFTPGSTAPEQARFHLDGRVPETLSGQMHVPEGGNVMAVAECADGSLLFDRVVLSDTAS